MIPKDYGERSLDNALPWTSIPTANFKREGDLDRLAAVTDFRYHDRIATDQEFKWLLSDVEEFNKNKDKKEISLLESTRREEMESEEAKRAARKAAQKDNGPLLQDSDTLTAAAESLAVDEDAVAATDADKKDDDRPDLLLRESARIVRDMIELGNDEPALARQFSLLSKDSAPKSLN